MTPEQQNIIDNVHRISDWCIRGLILIGLVVVFLKPDVERIELNWHISAKDFDKKGKLLVNLTPRIDELDDIHFKNCERDVPEDGELIEDLMPYIQKVQKLLKQ